VDFKRNIFWIVLVVAVLGIVGAYVVMSGNVKSADGKDTAALKEEAEQKKKTIQSLAKQAEDKSAPDPIKNPEHVKYANDYKIRLENQLKTMQDAWKTRKLEIRFNDAPADASTKFDTWLGELRTKITEQATKAGLALPADADKLMFKEPTTDENSPDVTRHRDFRLRQMAIIEEVIGVLCRKYGKQQVFKFEPDKDKQEPQEQVETGVMALERIAITPSRSVLGVKSTDKGATSEDRLRTWMEDGVHRSGRQPTSGKAPAAADLPYTLTSIDVTFLAPLANVPAVAQALETNARFGASVVTRVDFQRAVTSPFPQANDPKLATAGPVPLMNTHYQEAPVRALVTLDIYEYDAAKDAAAKAKAEEKPADPKDKKKK
jgi:hypothetical protein